VEHIGPARVVTHQGPGAFDPVAHQSVSVEDVRFRGARGSSPAFTATHRRVQRRMTVFAFPCAASAWETGAIELIDFQ
jgi:hypothetical protein